MTGRPERRRWGVALGAALLAVAGCGADEAEPAAAEEVAVCTDLRTRQNELIQVANASLAELARAGDDVARAEALAAGYDRLIAALAAQEPADVPGEAELTELLAAGHEAALAELQDERDRFASVRAVTQSDERGRAGELQNALEKAFSALEPPRSAYVAAGLAEAIDADPGCRHVTQRGDPAR